MSNEAVAARLVMATANPGKIAELVDLFAASGLANRFTIEARPEDLADTIEDWDTLEANATKKAVEVRDFTGAAALADDTGLFVDALGGAPGVRTARFAGEAATDADNVAKLLRDLEGVEDRRARFRTVIAFADTGGDGGPDDRPDYEVTLALGEVEGTIATSPKGDGGFGYDPVFIPIDGDGRAFAEMTRADKQQISHRARALQALVEELSAD